MQWSLLVVLFLVPGYHTSSEGYYWREYFGRIPSDAIVAGQNANGTNLYIGQGYIHDGGIIAGQITPGVKKLCFPYYHICNPVKYVKILCGYQDNFFWLNANATHLHVLIRDRHPVIGGHDDNHGYINIGKISRDGDLIIGKIMSAWIGEAWFFYALSNGKETSTSSYAVLFYKKFNPATEAAEGYYWRQYFGNIPSDAVVAGRNADGTSVYVGQGYMKNGGISVGTITPGVKNHCFPHGGKCTPTKHVKILCGIQDNFYWLNANATHLHVLIRDTPPVIGGSHDDDSGYMNIGRISEDGEIKVGNVESASIGHAKFSYASNGTEKFSTSYGILLYKRAR